MADFVCSFHKNNFKMKHGLQYKSHFAAETKFYDFFTSSLKAYIIKLRIQ